MWHATYCMLLFWRLTSSSFLVQTWHIVCQNYKVESFSESKLRTLPTSSVAAAVAELFSLFSLGTVRTALSLSLSESASAKLCTAYVIELWLKSFPQKKPLQNPNKKLKIFDFSFSYFSVLFSLRARLMFLGLYTLKIYNIYIICIRI